VPASGRHHVLTLADYFEAERVSPRRHEFCDGQIFLMAGGSPRHSYLSTRLVRLLGNALEGSPCDALNSDQRIATADGLYTYADGSVFCGPMELGPEQTATNPRVVVEVLSDGTRAYDRGEKLDRYRSIPSLAHVVFVEQDGVDVEVWSRGAGGWSRAVYVDASDTVQLDAIGVALRVGDLYAGAERYPA
jgi:Uma2 family endonuclease